MTKPSVPFLVALGVVFGAVVGGSVAIALQNSRALLPPLPIVSHSAPKKVEARILPGTRGQFPGAAPAPDGATKLYLDLMKRSLTDSIYENGPEALRAKAEGQEWPSRAHTMIGLKRLDSLQVLVEDVLRAGVAGDFIECGAWRGGATIFMRAILKAYGVTNRKVWVSDSFEGLPTPNPEKYPADKDDILHTFDALAISLEQVRDHFTSYGLLDGQVEFLKGWFKDTLPRAKIDRLAVLRVDGDLYESTMDALGSLYTKVSVGGYVIVDDFGAVPGCKKAVEEFRAAHHITAELKTIDWTGVYWQKQ
jgi:O-methyltransferase